MRFSNLSQQKFNNAKFIGGLLFVWHTNIYIYIYIYIKQENVQTTFKFMNCLSALNGAGDSERGFTEIIIWFYERKYYQIIKVLS